MELIQTILLVFSFAFSVFVIVFALNCLKRLGGRLKVVVIFLILVMGAYILKEVLDFFIISRSFYFDFIFSLLVILFVFLAIVNIAQMLKIIDGEYKNVIRGEKQYGKRK